MRVTFTIHAKPGTWFDPDHFEPLIDQELQPQPGRPRAWLRRAVVTPDGLSAELTADLVELGPPLPPQPDEVPHGQGV
jgi:hypothetical protein